MHFICSVIVVQVKLFVFSNLYILFQLLYCNIDLEFVSKAIKMYTFIFLRGENL